MTSKYAALTAYLTAEHEKTGQAEFELTFAEVSSLVGGLPAAAYIRTRWWHNYKATWQAAGWRLQHVSISKNRLIFVTTGTPSATHPDMEAINGVRRLRQFFQELSQEQTQVALTFGEFGRIRGRVLYGNVQSSRERWANTGDKPWMQAGWEMQSIYARSRLVVFRRVGSDIKNNITEYVRHVLEGKRLKGPRPTALDLVKWLRLCHRLDWNFEGVVLYEKGGIDFGALDRGEQAELERDYLLCKRRLANSPGSQPGPTEPN